MQTRVFESLVSPRLIQDRIATATNITHNIYTPNSSKISLNISSTLTHTCINNGKIQPMRNGNPENKEISLSKTDPLVDALIWN